MCISVVRLQSGRKWNRRRLMVIEKFSINPKYILFWSRSLPNFTCATHPQHRPLMVSSTSRGRTVADGPAAQEEGLAANDLRLIIPVCVPVERECWSAGLGAMFNTRTHRHTHTDTHTPHMLMIPRPHLHTPNTDPAAAAVVGRGQPGGLACHAPVLPLATGRRSGLCAHRRRGLGQAQRRPTAASARAGPGGRAAAWTGDECRAG